MLYNPNPATNGCILRLMETHFTRPADADPDVIDALFRLIASGGQVRTGGLRSRLLASAMLGYIVVDSAVVAAAAIKRPHDTSLTNAFLKAASPLAYADFGFELGYIIVAPEFRRRGFALLLCRELCLRFRAHNLYATARVGNDAAQSLLGTLSFVESGTPFRNSRGIDDLRLYVRGGTGPVGGS